MGFVPSGFTRAGKLYYADRATANNPHPGTDSLLRLDAHTLTRLGARDGDMLAATEGGATMIAVHCTASCSVTPIIGTPTTAHGEGHLLAVAGGPAAGPATPPSTLNVPLGAAVLVVAVVAAAIAGVAIAWRRR